MLCSFQGALAQDTFIKKTYYDADQTLLKEVITLNKADSSLQGLYHAMYSNGSLSVTGFYHNDLSDSSWIYYFENGRVKAEGKFEEGKQTGPWKYYYENGNLKASGNFVNNIRHGHWDFYYENGADKSGGIYFNNKKEGIWNYFYEDGNLKAQAFYSAGKGLYKEFYPSGQLKMEGNNENDKSEGTWTYYHQSGEIEAVGEFNGGLRNGFWQYYHDNGQLAAEGTFNQGEKSGVWKYYFPDGSISSEGEMINDQKDGFWKLYYQSGEIKGEGRYDQGTGEYVEYYASGNQKSRGAVVDGKKEGQWVYFNEDGIEDGMADFKEGVGEYVGYYPDGTIKMTGTITDDKRTGKWTLYNPDGSVAGIYKPVYEEEKPIFRTSESIKQSKDKQGSDKPEYKYKKKRLRYFNPRINEYTGFIIGTNPIWTLLGSLPIAFEYYKQERLGYEVEVVMNRNPFFTHHQKHMGQPKRLGLDFKFRQKFYHNDTQFGMFYFGHQISGGFLNHSVNFTDTVTITPGIERRITSSESHFAYGLFVGDRWTQRTGDSGLTVDFNIGFSVGQRFYTKNYEPFPSFDQQFSELNQDKIYLPIIFTLNIGYLGPKRRSTSF